MQRPLLGANANANANPPPPPKYKNIFWLGVCSYLVPIVISSILIYNWTFYESNFKIIMIVSQILTAIGAFILLYLASDKKSYFYGIVN